MLFALEAADRNWWIDERIVVPRAVLEGADLESDEAVNGTIVDWEYDEGADASIYSVELDDGLELCWLTLEQLAGVEGLGPRSYAVECLRLDRMTEMQGKSAQARAARVARATAGGSTKKRAQKGRQPAASGTQADSAENDAEDDNDPLANFAQQLDSEAATDADASKMRQGWKYEEYTGNRATAREQPARKCSGVRHPKLRGRGADACSGKLRAMECQDCASPPEAMRYLHQQILTYAAGDVHQGGTHQPFNWMRRSRRPAPGIGEVQSSICSVLNCTVLYCTVLYTVLYCTVLYCTVLYCTVLYSQMWAYFAVCKIMVLVRCPVLREYWDPHSPAYNEAVAKIMRRDRFEAILTNMHFADRATDYPTGEDGLPREGRLPAGERNWDIQGY